jgi:hypothetical protein
MAEAARELDRALDIAAALRIVEMTPWVEARKQIMNGASDKLYEALFERLGGER